MGIHPCCPLPSPSVPSKASGCCPCLPGGKEIGFSNQVWSTDITHAQIEGCHMCPTEVIDWCSRYIVSWHLSGTVRACGVVAYASGRLRGPRHAARHEQRPGVCLRHGGVRLAACLRTCGAEHGRLGPLERQRADGEVARDAEAGVPEERGARDAGAARGHNPRVRGRARFQEAPPAPRLCGTPVVVLQRHS